MIKGQERYENLHITPIWDVSGEYGIPIIKPHIITDNLEFIGFNYAKSEKNPQDKGIHFFIDDYQFTRLWNEPERYIGMLGRFKCVLTPDFSLYADYPRALQIFNHYRKHVLGAYWQREGLTVIPTISWSNEESFEFCFDGEPKGGTVAVSSVGTQRNSYTKELFLNGYREMMKILYPETVIFCGNVPEECEGNIIRIGAFQDKFKKIRENR